MNTVTTLPPADSLRAPLLRRMTRWLLRPVLSGPLPPQQRRRRLERIAQLTQLLLPRGTLYSQQPLGGVPTEWVENLHSGVQGYLLYFHGGAYTIGSPLSHRNVTAHLARRCALRVAAVDYRLAPEHPFPAAVDDALAAYRGLLDLGIAARDILIAGDSAGGGLALACALAARDAGLPQPAGIVCFSPWVDLSLSGASIGGRRNDDVMLTGEKLGESAADYLGPADARTPLASPLFADLAGLPPLLIQVGDLEILHDDATRLAAAAQAASVAVELQVWPGLWHVWQVYAGQLPEADAALYRVASFINSRLSG